MREPSPSSILATATAVPEHAIDQESVKRGLGEILPVPPDRRDAVMAMFDRAVVERRFSVLPLHELRLPRRLGQTMSLYREHAVRLGTEVAGNCLSAAGVAPEAVDLVITVSCTGVMIPSLDAYLAGRLGLRPDVRRMPMTELGCSAGAAALARAHDFLRGHPAAHVLVVAVELPTLSFQPDDGSLAQVVSTALFGDGAAAVLLAGEDRGELALVDTESYLGSDGLELLGFELRDDGFHVLLAKELPEAVRRTLGPVAARLLARAGLGVADLEFCALHPGGRRILVAAEEALGVGRALNQPAWDVLREYGNQSSAAVLFVLHRLVNGPRPRAGACGLLGAFGPGLSTDLGLLRWS